MVVVLLALDEEGHVVEVHDDRLVADGGGVGLGVLVGREVDPGGEVLVVDDVVGGVEGVLVVEHLVVLVLTLVVLLVALVEVLALHDVTGVGGVAELARVDGGGGGVVKQDVVAHTLAGELDVGAVLSRNRAVFLVFQTIGELTVGDVEGDVPFNVDSVVTGALVAAAHDVERRRFSTAANIHGTAKVKIFVGLKFREIERALAQLALARKVHGRTSSVRVDV